MRRLVSMHPKGTVVVCQLALLALLLVVSGCTQPSSPQQVKTPAPVTVIQPDTSHITIRYPGSADTGTLLELEATVTDSTGNAQTKSIGSRFTTTPLKFGATLTLTGTFSGKDHVFVTGYFMDGSHRPMLDTTI